MMTQAALGILFVLAVLAVLNLVRWMRTSQRRAAIAALGDATRHATDVGIRVVLQRTRAVQGLAPGKAHRLLGDLGVTADRLLLVTDRGALLDLGTGRGLPMAAVRCPGPGRLLLEGEVPSASGPPGLYRFELSLDDAATWAEALRPFVREGGDVTIHPAARKAS